MLGRTSRTTSHDFTGLAPLNIQPLRAFCYVARMGSITKAAEALNLDQSTVSLHIKLVERTLDTLLFVRSGRGIRLTPDGAVLLQILAPAIDVIDRLPATFGELRKSAGEGTHLRLAAVESILLHVLPVLVARYREEDASVHIDLIHALSGDVVDLVRQGEADLGFVIGLEAPPSVSYRDWFQCPVLLLTQHGHPLTRLKRLTLTDIASYPLVLSTKQHRTREVVDAVFERSGIRLTNVVETAGPESIKQFVRLGLGVSILPSIVAPGPLMGIDTRRVDHLFPPQRYGIVFRPGKLPLAAQRFLRLATSFEASIQ